MIPQAVARWLQAQGWGEITHVHSVGGGCINNGARLQTSAGQTFFIKTNHHAPADMFAQEADGLQALRTTDGPRVPAVYLHGPDFLLLEDLAPRQHSREYWDTLGRQLAALHNHTQAQFGFAHDNYIGSTTQLNGWTADGYAFFAERRLLFQARLALKNGYFSIQEMQGIDRLAGRLRELVPVQPASLLHGDLWSGNAITDGEGNPAIIDPAAHFGWAEAELGMTTLFGGFHPRFYQAYEEVRKLEPGWHERLDLYNLYHLLNHLNLFGEGYYSPVMAVIRRYG
jgi:fructosamine-3-kinase